MRVAPRPRGRQAEAPAAPATPAQAPFRLREQGLPPTAGPASVTSFGSPAHVFIGMMRVVFAGAVAVALGFCRLLGGILAALIDLAGGAALFHGLQFPTPTIDMRVDHLRPAIAGKALLAEARVKRLGRTVGFVDVDVTDEDGRLVATGRCTSSVKDREGGPRGPIG